MLNPQQRSLSQLFCRKNPQACIRSGVIWFQDSYFDHTFARPCRDSHFLLYSNIPPMDSPRTSYIHDSPSPLFLISILILCKTDCLYK